MRVLSLVPGLDPARGGMAAAATNMLLAAIEAGVESVVAVPEQGGDVESRALIDQLAAAGVSVHLLPTITWPPGAAYRWGLSPAQAAYTARHVKKVDLVHVHGVWGLGQLSGLAAGRLFGRPVVVSPHESLTNFGIDGSRSSLRGRQKSFLKALYLRHTSMFVFASDFECDDSVPASAPQRTVHYPVVDTDRPVPALRVRGLEPGIRVGFLARVHPKKNLDLLIDAMAQLPDRVRLVIAGDGPATLVESLHRRAEDQGVSDRLEWLGFVEPKDRPRFLDTIDLLAMPSVFESFGLSAAEAMWHGVPVLVSDRTGVAEVIGRHGGGMVTKANVSAVVAAIRELDVNRSALGELGARGQSAVRQDLSYARIGCELRDLYGEVIDDIRSQ